MLLCLCSAHGGTAAAFDAFWLLLQEKDFVQQWSNSCRHSSIVSTASALGAQSFAPTLSEPYGLNPLEQDKDNISLKVPSSKMAGGGRLGPENFRMLDSAVLRASSFKAFSTLGDASLKAQDSTSQTVVSSSVLYGLGNSACM